MIVELFGYEYGKYEKVGEYNRVRHTKVRKYGIYPTNMEFSRVAEPLLYVYIFITIII